MINLSTNREHETTITLDEVKLDGILHIPSKATGLVLFVHGSGSSRLSRRNQYVASVLNKAGLATLLFDLLTPSEESIDIYTREYRFNIPLLCQRLIDTTHWCLIQPATRHLQIGYFGSSTGGGAALLAAAREPESAKAIVSRGGRPDLAGDYLPLVKTPTLLIVGGKDDVVIELNKTAMARMNCPVKLEIVSKATHLFEEPGTLATVARLAQSWFTTFLGKGDNVHG
ncbi:dienelactone hydrolase family protein [Legionella spiritensis]|uniref:Putative phosphoribosyl transferase n=1 Tax=Legionella spiritensis TaxID=452 RepID=A0A0W0YY04_LEGSP|nr:dienelactone hydrolase family protein [Legionella spiritensis]KTD61756.1 putative phosphoribosyl transferase [Legionella spiritensis]SNV38587.1 Predicted dienelactone hydrolase [Legionella spiritensis]